MAGFERTSSGRLVIRLAEVERGLLRMLVGQMLDFVAPSEADPDADPLAAAVGIDTEAQRPRDPALLRLLPDAYPDDPEASDDFRRFTERSLRDAKAANAGTVLATLERSGAKVTITGAEAQAWLLALNDVRLALGVRLGIEDDGTMLERAEDDGLAGVYDWLTFVQGTLIEALTAEP